MMSGPIIWYITRTQTNLSEKPKVLQDRELQINGVPYFIYKKYIANFNDGARRENEYKFLDLGTL